MNIGDLPPRKDPKGGSPKTPLPIAVRTLQEHGFSTEIKHGNGNGNGVWRTIAIALISMNVALGGAIWTLGINNVKWSDIDNIMLTRAPYLHDKERIWDAFAMQRNKDMELANQIISNRQEFTTSEGSFNARLTDLERAFYREHPLIQPPAKPNP